MFSKTFFYSKKVLLEKRNFNFDLLIKICRLTLVLACNALGNFWHPLYLLYTYFKNINLNNFFFIERFLNNSLNEKFVSKEDFHLVPYFVSKNNNSISWNFYKDNYLLLNKIFGIEKVNFIGNLICRTFFDEKDKQKVRIEV